MKKLLICLMLVFAVFICAACTGEEPESSGKKPGNSSSSSGGNGSNNNNNNQNAAINQLVASIGTEGVTLTYGKIEGGRYEDMAPVTAQVPNYTELFAAAVKAEDPTVALARAIDKKEFTTVEYTGYVTVTYEGETPVYHSEDLVKSFVEKELIKAINAVLESEAAA